MPAAGLQPAYICDFPPSRVVGVFAYTAQGDCQSPDSSVCVLTSPWKFWVLFVSRWAKNAFLNHHCGVLDATK